MAKKITYNGNTKQEIFDAYNTLLGQIKEQNSAKVDPVAEVAAKRTGETLTKAEKTVSLSVEEQIASLQKNVAGALANLSTSFAAEITAFQNVQEAIKLKQAELKELFDIEAEAFTLAALVNTNQVVKDEFEAEMAEKREEAKNQLAEIQKSISEARANFEAELKAEKASIAQERAREKEVYEYEFKRTKQKNLDQLRDELAAERKEFEAELEETNAELAAREKVVSEKEAAIEIREEKMEDLEAKVAAFPEREATIREEATKEGRAAEAKTAAIKESYLKKEYEGQRAIFENKIEMLEAALKAEQAKNATIADKLDEAYEKIQAMALASVEGSKTQAAMSEIARSLGAQQK